MHNNIYIYTRILYYIHFHIHTPAHQPATSCRVSSMDFELYNQSMGLGMYWGNLTVLGGLRCTRLYIYKHSHINTHTHTHAYLYHTYHGITR